MGILAVIGLAATIYSSYQQQEAQDEAAKTMDRLAAQNVNYIAEMGAAGVNEIRAALERAYEYDPTVAVRRIRPYEEVGREAFDMASQKILEGISESPYTQAISQAGQKSISGRPEFQNLSPAVQEAVRAQSGYTGEGYGPGMNKALLSLGKTGLTAAGDIGGITMRGAELAGDLQRQAAAQQSAALLGQVGPTLRQMQTGTEARLLSDISQQNMFTDLLGQGMKFVGSQIKPTSP